MKEIQIFSVVLITMAAVLWDLQTGLIPNGLIVTGLICGFMYHLFSEGAIGILLYFGGIILPVLLFAVLYFFRMLGAGDIKLFCVIGGYIGFLGILYCMITAVLFGGIIALGIMLSHHNLYQRLLVFSEYIRDYSRTKRWRSYMEEAEKEAQFCFSVPIFLSVLCYVGGIF